MKCDTAGRFHSSLLDALCENVSIEGTAAELEMLRDLCNAALAAGTGGRVSATRVTEARKGDPGMGGVPAIGLHLTVSVCERWGQ